MDITEIENTIKSLESGETTFANCQKLASLYVVFDHLKTAGDVKDSLPAYKNYCEVKCQYQKHQTSEVNVVTSISAVCKELKSLIHLIYSNSDMPEERKYITDCLQSTYQEFLENGRFS